MRCIYRGGMNIGHKITKAPLRLALAATLTAGLPATALIAPSAPLEAAEGDLDKAISALRAVSTMKADFTQTDRQGNTTRGVMTLKQPGKIRFEYEKSVNMLVVSTGKSLYLIDYDVSQVQRWPIKNSPLGALLDPNRDIKRYGKLMQTGNRDVLGVEVRDPKRPEFGVITLIFVRNAGAPGGFELTHWVALDSQNNRTTIRLRNQRYGVAVPDSTFKFKDPRKTSRRPG